jgi:hypothetical protein
MPKLLSYKKFEDILDAVAQFLVPASMDAPLGVRSS